MNTSTPRSAPFLPRSAPFSRRPAPFSLRRWLIAVLLCIAALPPLAVWVLHVASTATAGPSAQTLAAARTYATGNVGHWTDPRWQAAARAYFTAAQVDAELCPASGGPCFSTLTTPVAAHVQPDDKFLVTEPRSSSAIKGGAIKGSGWVIPHSSVRTSWTVPFVAGAITLAVTVAAAGVFLGRHVIRPLTAITEATHTLPYGEADLRLPATRVSEVNAAAVALQAMSDNLHAALEQQADSEEQRRQFVGAIAHDLRTPLFTLRAYLDGLNDGLATSPQRTSQYLQACRTSATALDWLITDLFSYARMEDLGQQPCREPVDLGALLRTAAQAHQPRADARHITLAVTTTAVPCTVSADEHLLTRVIGNLVDNALRHTPEHGQISLSCARADDEATFTVVDSGPGIDPADLPHLFTPLYRGEVSRNRATGGAGLGLAIAQRILLAHGGTLTAANAAPHGASFTARIPVV
jgi:signal transduction histidine kinase